VAAIATAGQPVSLLSYLDRSAAHIYSSHDLRSMRVASMTQGADSPKP
jgi:hypothetical protein